MKLWEDQNCFICQRVDPGMLMWPLPEPVVKQGVGLRRWASLCLTDVTNKAGTLTTEPQV